MAGNPNAIQLCHPVAVIVVNRALKVIPLGVCRWVEAGAGRAGQIEMFYRV